MKQPVKRVVSVVEEILEPIIKFECVMVRCPFFLAHAHAAAVVFI